MFASLKKISQNNWVISKNKIKKNQIALHDKKSGVFIWELWKSSAFQKEPEY